MLTAHHGQREVRIRGRVLVVGRSQGSTDLCIPSPHVARQHAVVLRNTDRFLMRELGTTNGTLRRGERIEEAVIGDGDVFRLGDEEVRFSIRPSSERRLP